MLSLCSITALGDALAAGEVDYSFFEKDYTYIADDRVESRVYSNDIVGSRIRLNMTIGQFNNIVSIKYNLVKIKLDEDKITYTQNDIFINGKAVAESDIAKTEIIYKSSFIPYENKDNAKYGYIDIVAYEWCAIVVDVKYKDSGVDTDTYSSYVYKVTNIDNSKPTAYYRSWNYDIGNYTFRVTVNGNQQKAIRSANSGIRKVEFLKVTGAGESAQTVVLDSVENISATPYFYDLKVSANQKAFYYARVIDWVGNESKNLIAAFGTYDEGFESAVNNTLEEIERAEGIFSPYILKNLTDEFATYGIRVQEFVDAQSDKKTDAAARVEVQKNVIYKLLREYANIRILAENGVRDFNLKVINEEYLSGVLIGNVNNAYTTLLYGEVANFTVVLADFDLRKFDKSQEIDASGLIKAERVLGITLETSNSLNGDIDIIFTRPVDIRIPLSNYKAVSAVVKVVGDNGNVRFEKLGITEYKSYFLVHMPYSKGTLTVVFGQKAVSPYYWFFTLLVIPVGILAYFLIKEVKERKLERLEQLEKERMEAKLSYVAKNKSKKGNKKKK
jgi:hypothetical protein